MLINNPSFLVQVAYEAALQSFVLLKNEDSTLPLKRGLKLAVVGPMAVEVEGLISDYAVAAMCDDGSYKCQPSIADALGQANTDGSTSVSAGVSETGSNTSGIAEALEAVKGAEVIILVLGQTKATEHEGIDRPNTLLPGIQESFAQQVIAAAGSKPVVLVLVSGGIVSFDSLKGKVPAIVDAFNPAMYGPKALATTLFGDENRFGKLPVTIYPGNYSDQIQLQDMSYTSGPGRSYRYYTGTPLYPFGYGLSYTTFELSCHSTGREGTNFTFGCTLRNSGTRRGDEVIIVYHTVSEAIHNAASHPIPQRQVVEFTRMSLEPNEEQHLTFTIPQLSFSVINENGAKILYSGQHSLVFSHGVPGGDVSIPVSFSDTEELVSAIPGQL